jgi:lathosterol oxidase
MWEIHRHHHKFYNPSPFAVIADEAPDQLVRALPLLVLPIVMPMNMDLLFFT